MYVIKFYSRFVKRNEDSLNSTKRYRYTTKSMMNIDSIKSNREPQRVNRPKPCKQLLSGEADSYYHYPWQFRLTTTLDQRNI